jgi:chromosome segregation ATPase
MSRSANRDQIQEVVARMREVRGNRGALLRKMLNENEKVTRETVSAEVEVKNLNAASRRLSEEISRLHKDVKHGGVVNAKADELLKAAREEASGLGRANSMLAAATKKLDADVRKLTSDTGKLAKEVSQLEAEHEHLTSDARRLKDLRAKYMSELAKFKVR